MNEQEKLTDPEVLRHIALDFRQMTSFMQDPLIFERANGVHLWDIHDKHYYDGLSGSFVVAVGHGNRRVKDAIIEQMERISFAPMLHGTNPKAIILSELLARLTPGDLSVVKLLCSGSEATEASMKLCRQYWKQAGKPSKYKIISRYHGYHGSTLGATAASGTPSRRVAFEPLPAGFVHVPTVHCYRCPYGHRYPDCEVFCVEHLRHVIEMESPDTVAALIVEPIGNTGGILVPPPDYLPRLRQVCDRYDVLLIFDELITGMGRTGQMFAAQTFDVTPDILCLGKGLSSGYAPLAATVWSERIQEAFLGPEEAGIEFGHGHTFGNNPISAAAGLANVSEIIDRDMIGNTRLMGEHLRMRLEEMTSCGIIGEVRGKGLLWGVELVKDPVSREPFSVDVRIGKRIGAEAQARGLILRHDPNWIAIAPPLIVTEEELDDMCGILAESINTVLERV